MSTDVDQRNQHGWRAEAWRRLDLLTEHVAELQRGPGGADPEVEGLASELAEIGSRLNHSNADAAWQRLHRVEEHVAGHAAGHLLKDYAIWATEHAEDPAVREHKGFTSGPAWRNVEEASRASASRAPDPSLAADVESVLHHAHALIDERHLAANECHDRLRAAAWAASGLSLLIVLAAVVLDDLPFLVGTESFADVPPIQVALLVVLGGLVGGSWGAFPAFTSTQRDRYRLQYVRAGTRLAMGVLSALIGVSLVGAGWVSTLNGSSAPALFAVAVAFGLAQEPVTKILEAKLGKAVEESSGTGQIPAG